MNKVLLVQALLVLLLSVSYCNCKKHKSKYSAEANQSYEPTEKYDPDFRTLQKPYRMAKLNLVWSKAVHVSVRTELNYLLFILYCLSIYNRLNGHSTSFCVLLHFCSSHVHLQWM